jgi:hypothetical protein
MTTTDTPDQTWTDAMWDEWFRLRRERRERTRAARRARYLAALEAGRTLVEMLPSGVETRWPAVARYQLDGGLWTFTDVARHVEAREEGFGFTVRIEDPARSDPR